MGSIPGQERKQKKNIHFIEACEKFSVYACKVRHTIEITIHMAVIVCRGNRFQVKISCECRTDNW